MTAGVDIYRYQTVTDYRALAGAVDWVWVKLSDGGGPATVRGDAQVNGCKAAGIPVGGYHYAQPGDPRLQAKVLLAEVERLGATGIAPALDIESPFQPNSAASNFAITFLSEIAARGYRPAVYMSASWAAVLRPDQWGFQDLIIWIAAYGSNSGTAYNWGTPNTVTKYYSGRYDVHQHTSTARVPGISGQVDLNWALTGVPWNSKEDGMSLDDVEKMVWRGGPVTGSVAEGTLISDVRELQRMVWEGGPVTGTVDPGSLIGTVRAQGAKLDEIAAKLDTVSTGGVDANALAEALAAQLGPAVAKAVNDEFARRQAE